MWHLSGTFLGALGPSADLYLMSSVNRFSFPPPRLPKFVRNPMAGGIKLGERKVFLREWRKELEPAQNDDENDSATDAAGSNIGDLGGAEEYDNVRKEYEEGGDLGMLPGAKLGDSKNRPDTATALKQGKSKNPGADHSETALLLGTHKRGKLKTSIVQTALPPLIRMRPKKSPNSPRKKSASPQTKTRPKISDLIRHSKRIWPNKSKSPSIQRSSSSSKFPSKKRPIIDPSSKYRHRSSRSNSGSRSTRSPVRFSGSKTSSRNSSHQRNHIRSQSRSPKKTGHSSERASGSKSCVRSPKKMPSKNLHSSLKCLLSPGTYRYRVVDTPAPTRAGYGDCDNLLALDFMVFGDHLNKLAGDWASRLEESVNYEKDIEARKHLVCSDLVKLMIEGEENTMEKDDEEKKGGRGELEEEDEKEFEEDDEKEFEEKDEKEGSSEG
uniref:Uncharacterized protein n=1 Tax=Cacopsylla melanoneura TaxID=428564 RepID=A0A8D9F8W0_9HEMI